MGAVANVIALWAVNIWPGLASGAIPVRRHGQAGLINTSLVVGIVISVAALAIERVWFGALGALATTLFSSVVEVRIWQLFPFDVTEGWALMIRVLLALAIAGTIVAVVTHVRTLGRAGVANDGCVPAAISSFEESRAAVASCAEAVFSS